ncbi:unnamed protein product, partial [Prorocentrum cordatum]
PADQDPHAAACRGAAWNGGSARRPAPQPAASSPQEGPPPPRWRRPPPRRARGPSLRPSEGPTGAPPTGTQPCPRPAVLRPAGARPAGARPLAGASPCLRRTRDLPLEAEAAARSSRGNIDGPNNPTKHGRELLGGHMPHANPTPTPQDF